MRPSFWSKKAHDKDGMEWHQNGMNIRYEESPYNKIINEINPGEKQKNYM
jgi:hypothetical protein